MGRKATPSAPAIAGLKREKGRSLIPFAGCKRRRTLTGWASLPTDMTLLVARRVLAWDVVDYIAFRAVCSAWRACTPSPRDPTMRNRHALPRAWVALCGGDGVRPDDAGEITFFHTRTARSLRVRLPELRHHRIVGFTDGLLILLHKRTTAVSVLHPFTGVAVDLPPLAPVYHRVVRNRNSMLHMSAAVCAASPTSIAVVVWFLYTPGVLSAEPGRPGWEVIHKEMQLSSTLLFQDRLYGIVPASGQIVQVYPPNPLGPVVARVQPRFRNPILYCHFLVETAGHMLLVVEHRDVTCQDTEPWALEIFKVDAGGSWGLFPVSSLGDRALFLSQDRCLSVSAKDIPSISSNLVYFTTPMLSCVILSLSDGSFEWPTMFCQVHDRKERIRPSVRPFTIADHLITYCSHCEWSRGLMFHEFRVIPECFEDLHKKIRQQDSQLRIPRIRDGDAKK